MLGDSGKRRATGESAEGLWVGGAAGYTSGKKYRSPSNNSGAPLAGEGSSR